LKRVGINPASGWRICLCDCITDFVGKLPGIMGRGIGQQDSEGAPVEPAHLVIVTHPARDYRVNRQVI